MTDIVIQAENLGKHCTIGHQTERDRDLALRDVNAKPLPFAICHSPFSILHPQTEHWTQIFADTRRS